MAARTHVSCGFDAFSCKNIRELLDGIANNGFDFLCTYLVHPKNKRELLEGPATKRPGPLTRSDVLVNNHDWNNLVVAKISPWIQVDSEDEFIRRNSELALEQELRYAVHLAVPSVLIELNDANIVNLARITSHYSQDVSSFWVRVPLVAPTEQLDDLIEGPEELSDRKPDDSWHWWDTFRTLCEHNKKLGVALEVTADLPSPVELERWMGEPIKCLFLPTEIFLTNKGGFPVLSKAHQAFVLNMFKYDVQVVITGQDRHGNQGSTLYLTYIEYLWKNQAPVDEVSKFAKGYEDHLQNPLQPLMDNLESQTYEIFEQDPVKYSQYQKAIYCALLDKVSEEQKDTKTLTIMVLGAGRGPLVTASIKAAEEANRKIKVFAVEKNPNAIVTLENKKADSWGDIVTIHYGDMREWDPSEKADIIVSELLGSFGDNELSPECLDGAQKCLKDDGISIPREYTSHVAPLTSSKLWNQVKACKMEGKPHYCNYETPYVVRIHNAGRLDAPQSLFTFVHPNKASRIDNNRYKSCTFTTKYDSTLHGFAGYFSCVLYGDVNISIHPETHSPGMFSWFPIYIPIIEPIRLHAGEKLTAHFWRVCDTQKVWYEWSITEPCAKPIHNSRGRSYTIGL